jgi:hypothetical protein
LKLFTSRCLRRIRATVPASGNKCGAAAHAPRSSIDRNARAQIEQPVEIDEFDVNLALPRFARRREVEAAADTKYLDLIYQRG